MLTADRMRLDHVIYGTSDLDAAQALVERELGLEVHPGGRHVGQGTHNRIVPLGNAYLELLAISDPDEAAASPVGSILAERIAQGDGLLSYAVSVDDVHVTAQRLGTPIVTVRRGELEGHLTGVEEALRTSYLPFFGRSRGRPAEAGQADLDWIEVSGDAARLNAWLGGAELPIRITEGAGAVRAVSIAGKTFSG
jgi:catechol 2,3-dioxygenase-like lactoylglutathione lyase family enzyme